MARNALRQENVDEELIEAATSFQEDVSEEVAEIRKRYRELKSSFQKTTDQEHEQVVKAGGLHIIGTERHESRRIDNQLRGRAGRQGDPGSSQFYIALEDDLMRLFGGDRITPMIERLGMEEDTPLEAGMLTKQIENAQKRVESRNYQIRKNVLQFDDVMNQQREIIYGQRMQVLRGENMREVIRSMEDALVDEAVNRFCAAEHAADWDVNALTDYLERLCIKRGTISANEDAVTSYLKEDLNSFLKREAERFYEEREQEISEVGIEMRELERAILLRSVDSRWMDHIDAMDQLRDGIGLRAYGQKDPVNEYKLESFDMFEEMVHLIREDTVRRLCQAKIERSEPQRKAVARVTVTKGSDSVQQEPPRNPVKAAKKIGRNDPCPCGSGKKYKNCCGKNT